MPLRECGHGRGERRVPALGLIRNRYRLARLFSYSAGVGALGLNEGGRERAGISGADCALVTNEISVVIDARAYEFGREWKRLNPVLRVHAIANYNTA